MDTSDKSEKVNENSTLQSKIIQDDNTSACRKRKRSDRSDAKSRKPVEAATAAPQEDSDSEEEANMKVYVTNQRARRLVAFEAALDNFFNYHIEIEQADENRVIMLRQTMTRVFEILRSSSYYAGALAFSDLYTPNE